MPYVRVEKRIGRGVKGRVPPEKADVREENVIVPPEKADVREENIIVRPEKANVREENVIVPPKVPRTGCEKRRKPVRSISHPSAGLLAVSRPFLCGHPARQAAFKGFLEDALAHRPGTLHVWGNALGHFPRHR